MSLEEAGVPTVAVHTHVFARLSKAAALARGMPTTRQAYVPQPLVGRTAAQLKAYVEGTDPISKRPFMQEIIEGLSGALNDEDFHGRSLDRARARLLEPDTEQNLHELFRRERWADYLPIVLPTEERVDAMLKGTKRAPHEIVTHLAPTNFREAWAITVEKIAVNAVMAGALPEHLPVILAIAATGTTARNSSTTSFAGVAVVNGPIRNEIGINSGIGATGPYSHANVAIGRAWSLLSMNGQGGSVPGETYMGSLGNPYAYSMCFAENEERSPWAPLGARYGFKSGESTVTAFRGGRYTQAGFGPRATWQEKFKRVFAATSARQGALLVMDPIVARGFADLGFDSKDKLIEWITENCTLPAREYWDDQWVQTLIHPLAVAGVEPYATNLKAAPDKELRILLPAELNIVVTGGETQGAWRVFEATRQKDATVSIDAWR